MKLLLDEHYSPRIAGQLRKRGFDVIAQHEIQDLAGAVGDDDLLRWASRDRRALLTENVQDFAPLHEQFLMQGERHGGIVFTSARKFPRSRAGIGPLVAALAGFLKARPGDGALESSVWWL